jgi:hypothetical protein
MEMDVQRQKAFEFCSDLTKQLLTLSTAIIAITITFSKDVFGSISSIKGAGSFWMTSSWVCYVIAIMFGIWALMALTGTLEPANGLTNAASIRGGNIRIPSLCQILFFLLGIGCTVTYAVKAGAITSPPEESLRGGYKIATAEQAIEEVKKQLPATVLSSRFSRIELLQSIGSSSQNIPVWHVQLEVQISSPNLGKTSLTKKESSSGLSQAKRLTSTPPIPSMVVDYFIDSKTGGSTSLGLPSS